MHPQSMMKSILENIERVIVGKRRAAEHLLIALLCQGHVLIEDVPGVGKTTMVSAMARSVDCSFSRIQFTPDILPSDITGFSWPNPKTGEFEFRPGLVMSNFILADEINRTSPKTQASLLEVMEEGQVTVDGVSRRVGPPFMVMATQNPIEYVGTYPLPEAQMDRFFLRISLGYPTPREEMHILTQRQQGDPLQSLRPVCHARDVIELQSLAGSVYVQPELGAYIVALVGATRRHPAVSLGVSPRGSLSLYRAAQARALYEGRDYVLPDDVKAMAPVVLAHRIVLRPDASLRNVTQDSVVEDTLKAVPVKY